MRHPHFWHRQTSIRVCCRDRAACVLLSLAFPPQTPQTLSCLPPPPKKKLGSTVRQHRDTSNTDVISPPPPPLFPTLSLNLQLGGRLELLGRRCLSDRHTGISAVGTRGLQPPPAAFFHRIGGINTATASQRNSLNFSRARALSHFHLPDTRRPRGESMDGGGRERGGGGGLD